MLRALVTDLAMDIAGAAASQGEKRRVIRGGVAIEGYLCNQIDYLFPLSSLEQPFQGIQVLFGELPFPDVIRSRRAKNEEAPEPCHIIDSKRKTSSIILYLV